MGRTAVQAPRRRGQLHLKPAGILVYRIYGWNGKLLYVGQTNDIAVRMASHARKPWWIAVEFVEWEEFPDRESATAEETRLIRALRPPKNKTLIPKLHVYKDGGRPRYECFKPAPRSRRVG